MCRLLLIKRKFEKKSPHQLRELKTLNDGYVSLCCMQDSRQTESMPQSAIISLKYRQLSAFYFFPKSHLPSNADITKPKIYYIFKKKRHTLYKPNNNNNEKLRPDWFGVGKAWGRNDSKSSKLYYNSMLGNTSFLQIKQALLCITLRIIFLNFVLLLKYYSHAVGQNILRWKYTWCFQQVYCLLRNMQHM